MRMILIAVFAALAACTPAPAPDTIDAPAAEVTNAAQSSEPNAQIDLNGLRGRIVALGRNPEWRIDADAQLGMVLVMPEQGLTFSADFAAPTRAPSGGAQLANGPLTLTLSAEPCSVDAVAFALKASVQVEHGAPMVGCGFVRWDWRLIELLPAIDACIAHTPRNRRVTFASPEGDGRVLVRLQGAQAPVDCRAPFAPAGGPAITTPADANLRIGGDGDAIFVRAPGENPGGECYEAPEVRAADGALLGWMDDPLGC